MHIYQERVSNSLFSIFFIIIMRCSLNQNGSFEVISELNAKWNGQELTYSIINYTPDFDKLRTALNLAMTSWDIEIPIKLKYVKDNSDITLEFSTTDKYFTDSPGVLAYAYFPDSGSLSGKIVFNDNYLWSIDGKPITALEYIKRTGKMVTNMANMFATYNILHTLIHEIGHSLGLVHSNYKEDIMYPFYNGVIELSNNDILRITNKYGKSGNNKRIKEWLKMRLRR